MKFRISTAKLIEYTHGQVKDAQQFIHFIAVEMFTIIVTGLVGSFNYMSTWTRKSSESLYSFVTHVTFLASKYPMQGRSSSILKVAEFVYF